MRKEDYISSVGSRRMLDSTLCSTAYRLATHVGMPWSSEPPQDLTWDGSVGRFGGLSSSNVVHEIAHWVVCPRKYRHLREFGLGNFLGSSPQAMEDFTTRWGVSKDSSRADKEEEQVSMLGIQIEFRLGWDWRDTAIDQGWDLREYHFVEAQMRRNRKLYDAGRPRCLLGFPV